MSSENGSVHLPKKRTRDNGTDDIANKKDQANQGLKKPSKSTKVAIVVGAGLAGLAAAQELQDAGIEVIVVEARDRVGGRCFSDSMKPLSSNRAPDSNTNSNPVNVDLGASWIHGVEGNPMSRVCDKLGLKFICTNEVTIMKDSDGSVIPADVDANMDMIFNEMLENISRSKFAGTDHGTSIGPSSVQGSENDYFSTVSIGWALEEMLLAVQTQRQFTPVEKRLLQWHIANQEYAAGETVDKLSLQELGNSSEFPGPHAMLKQGFHHLAELLASKLDHIRLSSPVTRIEYSVPNYSRPNPDSRPCRVFVTDDLEPLTADAVLVTVPLGVLKARSIEFVPELPSEKVEVIDRLGFGLLNKVYLQFPCKFWGDSPQFGHASESGRYFLFCDITKVKGVPLIMTLASGPHASEVEDESDERVISSVVETLTRLFPDETIPAPCAYQITRWGSDQYSRGSYSYLGVGCSVRDLLVLGAPYLNRLFIAGEAVVPELSATTHGAYISGIEAARMMIETLLPPRRKPDRFVSFGKPPTGAMCELCGEGEFYNERMRSNMVGSFVENSKHIWLHECCAFYSPEVVYLDGVWFNVSAAVRRGRRLCCHACKRKGATVGCNVRACRRSYHVPCAVVHTGWSFDPDPKANPSWSGKRFFCPEHRAFVFPDEAISSLSYTHIPTSETYARIHTHEQL